MRTTDLSNIPVEIGLQGEDGYPHKGHMDYASPQVDHGDRHAAVRAPVRQQGSRAAARPVRAGPDAGRAQDKALLTRDDAIGTSQEGSYVLVVGTDNVVQRKIVKTGREAGSACGSSNPDSIPATGW